MFAISLIWSSIEPDKRSEIVRIVGFSFGGTTDSAASKSTNSVESFRVQNSRPSSSLLNFGISFFFFGIFSCFLFRHLARGDDSDAFIADREGREQKTICISSAQRKVSLLACSTRRFACHDQRQIEKDLFTLAVCRPMEVLVLVRITVDPVEAFTVFENFGHRLCI